MAVYNKRGRKARTVTAFAKTWVYFDGEWVYQGECGRARAWEITKRDEKYVYYTRTGNGMAAHMRQEV